MIKFLFVFLTIDSEYRIDIDELIRSTDASTDEISGSSSSISVDIYESERRSVR
jgi:hypothetical protein